MPKTPRSSSEAKNPKRQKKAKKEKAAVDWTSKAKDSCCLRVQANVGKKPQPSLLQRLLGSLPVDRFLESFFRSKAVHVSSTVGHRFEDLHEVLSDPQKILHETASETIFVWVPSRNKSADRSITSTDTTNSSIKSIEVSDPEAALALLESGHATYCRAPLSIEEELVQRLLQDTQLGCGHRHTALARGEVEVFIGATLKQTTGWHTDFQENFTIQLSGRKQWKLRSSTVQHPLRGVTPHYAAPEMVEPQLKAARLADPGFAFDAPPNDHNSTGPVETVVLEPGDVLYHPAGIWHQVQVLEPGISINVSLMSSNYASLVCDSLQHYMLRQPAWRQCVRGARPLEALLQKLPDVIHQFQQETGVDAILPPAVRKRPSPHSEEPTTQVISSQPEESDEEENDGSIDRESGGDSDLEEVDVDEGDHNDPIIDADAFAVGVVSNFEGTLKTNPLALVLEQGDIDNYYSGSAKNTEKGRVVCVLNVNYAGNENHESLVRVRFLTRHFDAIAELLGRPSPKVSTEVLPLVNFLLYHGYLLQRSV